MTTSEELEQVLELARREVKTELQGYNFIGGGKGFTTELAKLVPEKGGTPIQALVSCRGTTILSTAHSANATFQSNLM